MVSGAVPVVPRALLDQLKPGGRLFAIEGAAPAMEAVLYTRAGDDFRRVAVFETVVPFLLDAEPASVFAF
jgi:protein-L-isoaspartate(D-aspartate) O-methyltransferase